MRQYYQWVISRHVYNFFFVKNRVKTSSVCITAFALLITTCIVVNIVISIFFSGGRVPAEAPYDLYVYSVYYYKYSKSLGSNAVAFVLSGPYELLENVGVLRIMASNSSHYVHRVVDLERTTLHNVCRWIAMFATTETVDNLNSISIYNGDRFIEVPIKQPQQIKRDVVHCIAPLFASEQWQNVILAAHLYHRFGSHPHIYIRSVIKPLFQLLKIYESMGYLTVEPWHRVAMKTPRREGVNVNLELEFRNQAAAQTDCLLQYKETATFISMVDLDDLLVPRIGTSYINEFNFFFDLMPDASFITYGKENAILVSARNIHDFSLKDMLNSVEFQQANETGKLVTRPENFNHTWIHWPGQVRIGFQKFTVPNRLNALTHLKTMVLEDDSKAKLAGKAAHFNPHKKTTISTVKLILDHDLDAIEKDFLRLRRNSTIRLILSQLPSKLFYQPLIADCFQKTFYSKQDHPELLLCPGPDRCDLPTNTGIMCFNAATQHFSFTGSDLHVHFQSKGNFMLNNGCRQ